MGKLSCSSSESGGTLDLKFTRANVYTSQAVELPENETLYLSDAPGFAELSNLNVTNKYNSKWYLICSPGTK